MAIKQTISTDTTHRITRLGIQTQFMFLVAIVIATAVIGFSWFFIHHESETTRNALLQRARGLGTNLAYNSRLSVLARDSRSLNELATGVVQEEDVVYAMIVDTEGTVLGHSEPAKVGSKIEIPRAKKGFIDDARFGGQSDGTQDDIIHFFTPVELVRKEISKEDLILNAEEMTTGAGPYTKEAGTSVEVIGYAFVGVSTQGIAKMMSKVRAVVAIIAIIIGCGAVTVVYAMTRPIVVPIKNLVKATESIAEGDLSHKVEEVGAAEVAELARSFNRMVNDLRRSHEEIEEYSRTLEEKVIERTADLEEANRNLRELQAQLIQASKMAAMGQFGAGVAHELNQPLAGITGYTDLLLLKLEKDSPEWRYAKKIEDQCIRMTKIVNNLRTFARQSKFEYSETDINQPIDDALMLLGEQLRSRNITLKRDLTPNLPKVLADANQLEQVFLNLITNARDAIEPKGSGMITVISRLSTCPDFIEVLVADNGIGMDKQTMADIFNPFFTTKEVGKGTGLGLSISLGIIENHGGKIEVHSVLGQGSVFRVFLPVIGAPSCWDLVNCKSVCGFEREDCPAFKNRKGHMCWEEIAKRHRRKGDPLPPNCKNCSVYKRKTVVPLSESWSFEEVAVQ